MRYRLAIVHFHLAEGPSPRTDESVGLVEMGDTIGIGLKARVVAEVRTAHRRQQLMPVLLDRDIDCDIAVIGGVDIERRARMAAVAGTRRNAPRVPVGLEMRGEGDVSGFLHRDLDQPALSGALTLE